MIVVLAGSIGRFPVGGHAWVEMQYLLGLRALGHDVYYLEECGEGSWVYDWEREELTTDLAYPTGYVDDCLRPFGFGDRWAYRAGTETRGMSEEALRDVCRAADLLVIRGAPLPAWREEYTWPARRAFIDVDPGFTQFKLANGDRELRATVDRSERLFTIGRRLGAPDCPIPTVGRRWLQTVSPVFLPEWPFADVGDATAFTTIMQWHSYREVVYDGVAYGNKEREFPAYLDLPRRTAQPLCVALTGGPAKRFREHGWTVVEGWARSFTPGAYQEFIRCSRAELCVAKHGYVATRSGWFSDRSVCYLASGRPVLVQDTGLGEWLPTGRGVLTFGDPGGALRGIDTINSDYPGHRRAAREIATRVFASDVVLSDLVDAAMA